MIVRRLDSGAFWWLNKAQGYWKHSEKGILKHQKNLDRSPKILKTSKCNQGHRKCSVTSRDFRWIMKESVEVVLKEKMILKNPLIFKIEITSTNRKEYTRHLKSVPQFYLQNYWITAKNFEKNVHLDLPMPQVKSVSSKSPKSDAQKQCGTPSVAWCPVALHIFWKISAPQAQYMTLDCAVWSVLLNWIWCWVAVPYFWAGMFLTRCLVTVLTCHTFFKILWTLEL